MTHPDSIPASDEALVAYDAGLLNDHGGGNVEWWQDYIRAQLGRAHDFYAVQFHAREAAAKADAEMLAGALERIANHRYDAGGAYEMTMIARQALATYRETYNGSR